MNPILRLRNDLYCVEWGVKLYSLTHSFMNMSDYFLALCSYSLYIFTSCDTLRQCIIVNSCGMTIM